MDFQALKPDLLRALGLIGDAMEHHDPRRAVELWHEFKGLLNQIEVDRDQMRREHIFREPG